MIHVDTVTAPAHWASALINGDWSDLDGDEAARCSRFIDWIKPARVVSIRDDEYSAESMDPYFVRNMSLYAPSAPALGGDVLDYVTYEIVRDVS